MSLNKLLIGVLLSSLIGISYDSNNNIEISKYIIKSDKIPDEFNDFKILQLSDLHNKQFGKKNQKLIAKIDTINPDIIVITGDMLLRTKINYTIFKDLIYELSLKYKVYFVSGNHEQKIYLKDKNICNFYKYMKSIKVNIIDNKCINIYKNKSCISLYGIRIPLNHYRYGKSKPEPLTLTEIKELIGVNDKSKFNILLAHNPFYFKEYALWGADLILSGHVHGGMIKLPLLGPLLSPERKLFPIYSGGKYSLNGSTLVVSRGLGSGSISARLFNRPELCVFSLNN